MRTIAILFVLTCSACGGSDTDALEERLAALETDLASEKAKVAALEAVNASYLQTWMNSTNIQSTLSADANGDIVIEGANLRVRSGSGSTDGTVNGAGNVIIGYGEANSLTGQCTGGTDAGNVCVATGCVGGSCTAVGEQTGSHNLIVGKNVAFTSWGGVASGSGHVLNAAGAVALGRNNVVNGDYGVVSGGTTNLADAENSTVSGGVANQALHSSATVSGGSGQATMVNGDHVP